MPSVNLSLQAEKEICRALRLKDCQAWHVTESGLCRSETSVPSSKLLAFKNGKFDFGFESLVKCGFF